VTNRSQRCGGNDLETPRKAIFEVGGGVQKNLSPAAEFGAGRPVLVVDGARWHDLLEMVGSCVQAGR
jgi:hypothetical protein